MDSLGMINSGLTGIHRGLSSLRRDANAIADVTSVNAVESVDAAAKKHDLAEPLVNLSLDRTQVEASAKVVQAYDNTVGTLLDIRA